MKKKVSFSQHLFWDVDKTKLDFEKNKKYIIKSVLLYGLINDWNIIKTIYGVDKIAQTAIQIRDLDKKTANFIAIVSAYSKTDFICYTTTQLSQKHWNF